MEKITGLEMKISFTLTSPGWKTFNSLSDESDKPMNTYRNKFMR